MNFSFWIVPATDKDLWPAGVCHARQWIYLFYFIHCLLLLPLRRYPYWLDLLSRNALHLRVDHQKGLNIFGVSLHTRGPPERVYNISGDNLITMRGPTQEGAFTYSWAKHKQWAWYHNYCTATLDTFIWLSQTNKQPAVVFGLFNVYLMFI